MIPRGIKITDVERERAELLWETLVNHRISRDRRYERREEYKVYRALQAIFGKKITRLLHEPSKQDGKLITEIITKIDAVGKPHRLNADLEEVALCFGGLEKARGKYILDLGCGSTCNQDDPDYFAPWLCRALQELGAHVIGIDIESQAKSEKFTSHVVDLSKPGALNFLPSVSFDAVNFNLMMDSPSFEATLRESARLKKITYEEEEVRFQIEMARQLIRLLKDDGKIINCELGLERFFTPSCLAKFKEKIIQ